MKDRRTSNIPTALQDHAPIVFFLKAFPRVPRAPRGSFLWLLLTLVGCSSPEEVRVPVQGAVFVGNKPASYGAVILLPDASKGNASKHEPRGKIEPDGKFQVQTTTQNGAPAGWYKIGVTVTEPVDPKNPYVVLKSLIAAKYNNPETSGLAFEVVAAPKAGAYDLKLDPN